ncbi:MAG: MCP four helix bundle domain-containing protein [Chloroflexota bacterium]
MGWLHDVPLRVKLFGSFGVMFAVMAAVGFAGIHAAGEIRGHLDETLEEQLPAAKQLARVEVSVAHAERDARGVLLTQDPRAVNRLRTQAVSSLAAVDETWGKFKALQAENPHASGAEARAISRFDSTFVVWKAALTQAFNEAEKNTPQGSAVAAELLLDKVAPLTADLAVVFETLSAEQAREAVEQADDAVESYGNALKLIGAILLAGLAFALSAGWIISNSVVNGLKPVMRVVTSLADNCATWLGDALRAMADGDLTREVKPRDGTDRPVRQGRGWAACGEDEQAA